ncbi:hypothetical protein [Oceanobacillus profundus]|uniref:hypothetical protein n=1 Tax=Oceanobacillus profundus TaxID=372463 RepID=UPI0016529280|nr:hypothetical protein [Oceanobacillus profundus]MBR2246181.1 hypothetical protein [Bacilli bacterium]MBR3119851.1 hypothetical protein [Oceanobacillus sp.]
MRLVIEALLMMIRNSDYELYVKQGTVRLNLEKNVMKALTDMDERGWQWAISNIIEIIKSMVGLENTYYALQRSLAEYSTELSEEQSAWLTQQVNQIRSDLRDRGVNTDRPRSAARNAVNGSDIRVANKTIPNKINEKLYKPETNNSYAGSDIVASINIPGKGPVIFGELTNVSYSIFREKVPVRSLGSVTMRGYTRGMRTVSGILSFTVFDESVVYQCLEDLKKLGYRPLMDEMPLFDVTITMANEFGSRSNLTIYGVTTFTEGMVLSVDDLMTQNVYEFYAIDVDPIAKLESKER